MDYFYKPYRKDLFKELDDHMKFETKNPQWSSLADGIIGKNKKVNDTFNKALKQYQSYSKTKSQAHEKSIFAFHKFRTFF
jgi:uncharacterized NAD(P)/FAD-binding protein YdhS